MEKNLKQTESTCLKIVLFGPESTGKTTLAKKLARHYNSVWVREYARKISQTVTIFGAGFVVKPMVDYLAKNGFNIIIADNNPIRMILKIKFEFF